jgi:hypothetical protein
MARWLQLPVNDGLRGQDVEPSPREFVSLKPLGHSTVM